MRVSHARAQGQALHEKTTRVPFAPRTSAIESSRPSMFFIFTVASGAASPMARAVVSSERARAAPIDAHARNEATVSGMFGI